MTTKLKDEANKFSDSLTNFKNSFSNKLNETLSRPGNSNSNSQEQPPATGTSPPHNNPTPGTEENLNPDVSTTSTDPFNTKLTEKSKSYDTFDENNNLVEDSALLRRDNSEVDQVNQENAKKLKEFETLFQEMVIKNSQLEFEVQELRTKISESEKDSANQARNSQNQQDQDQIHTENARKIKILEDKSIQILNKNNNLLKDNQKLKQEKDNLSKKLNHLSTQINQKVDLLHSFQNEANLAKSNFETLKAETDVLKNNFKIDEDNKNKMILKMEEELEKYKNYGKSLVDNLQEAKSSLEVTGNQLKQKEVEIGNLKKLLDREKNSASEQDSTVNTLLETNGQLRVELTAWNFSFWYEK